MKNQYIIILLFFSQASLAQYRELNLDFELYHNKSISYWLTNEDGIKFHIDSTNVYHGKYALTSKVIGNAKYAQVFQEFLIHQNKSIEFSGYISGQGYLAVNVDNKVYKSELNSNTTGFNLHRVNVPLTPTSKIINILCVTTTEATFDNLKLIIDGVEYGDSFNELNAIHKQTIEKNAFPFSLKDPVYTKLKDINTVNLIGIGEGTHGTSEFKQTQYQLSQFLIEKHAFNTILIEGNYFEIKALNNYILFDTLSDVKLGEISYWIYKNEEFLAFLGWLKDYNSKHEKKIQLIGYDFMHINENTYQIVEYFSRLGKTELSRQFSQLIRGLPDIKEIQLGIRKPTKKYLNKLIALESKINFKLSEDIQQDIWMLKQYCKIIKHPSPNLRSNLLIDNISFFSNENKKQVVLSHNGHISEIKSKFKDDVITFCTIAYSGNYEVMDANNNITIANMETPKKGSFEYYLSYIFSTPTVIYNDVEIYEIVKTMAERNIGSLKPDREFIYSEINYGVNDYIIYFPETKASIPILKE